MRRKGMRDVANFQNLSAKLNNRSREQTVTEFARLEHEKARLERELFVWVSKQEQTTEQLQQVKRELEAIQIALSDTPPTRPAASARRDESVPDSSQATPNHATPAAGDKPKARKGYREVTIEY